MSKYIGVTIGPIGRTIQFAKKVREIWTASYVFSYIMREIIKNFNDRNIVVPYIEKGMLDAVERVGIFPDRFIFESKEGDFEQLKKLSDKIISDLEEKYKPYKKDQLKDYFQVYFVENDFDSNISSNEIIKSMTEILDGIDLSKKFIKNDIDIIGILSPEKEKSFLLRDGGYGNKIFQCIADIAAYEFKDFLKEDSTEDLDDDDIYKRLDSSDVSLKKPHKYIAIVYYDGDNFGETLKTLSDTKDFSKSIYDFSKKAVSRIKEFGGLAIYASGDDGFFFAPVRNGKINIFDLINSIRKDFDDIFKPKFSKVSLSFGVSISYYKYPMNEAISETMNLLFDKSKKFKGKNALSFKILKHSGHYFEGIFNQHSDEYKKFISILNYNDENMLSSLIFKTANLKELLKAVGKDKIKSSNVFDNFFNEGVHADKRKQIEEIRDFYISIMESDNYKDFNEKINLFHSALRYNKFLEESV